jgi:Plasmid pRiA4b ORF-3-like protein
MTTKKTSRKSRAEFDAPCLYTLKIELYPQFIQPTIWRRLDVDGRVSLAKLHHFIQAAFGWTDAHLHEYTIGQRLYGIPDREDLVKRYHEQRAKLNRLLATGDQFLYSYDFGDNWQHRITVEAIDNQPEVDPMGGAWVIGGARACPPEDVGGVEGYYEFLDALLTDPKSEEAQRMHAWAGVLFDPNAFDIRLANAAILRILYNHWGGA